MPNFTGRWLTSFGPMQLQEQDGCIVGTYRSRDQECTIEGDVSDGYLRFTYEEPGERGTGWFTQPRFGKFVGKFLPQGGVLEGDWIGQRAFDGIWDSSFGRLRLIQEADRIFGFYEGLGPATIEGVVEGDVVRFRYQEPTVAGEGMFEIADDLESFSGQWRPDGNPAWGAWLGKRVRAQSQRTWLLVLEAHWQRSLADQEYSFGRMLSEFFARHSQLAVRHRFFDDEAGLERWCRELLYFPEPAVVLVASHGTPEGLNVHGKTINSRLVIDYLRHAENLKLLHFSSCLVLKEEAAGDFAKRLEHGVPFPISGYTTSVDWGGSAVLEFNYLDMILAKGLAPAEAAEQLVNLIGFAGDITPPGSPYPAAGFRFFAPDVPPGEPATPRPPTFLA